jgi:hypothetical protein
VPQGIDSDTDAETDADRRPDSTYHAPPDLPPKDIKPPDAVHTSPTTTVESDGLESREETEETEDGPSVERTSHSTYIAPALPPIRFSMNSADFSGLLSSVGGLSSIKKIEAVETSRRAFQADIPVTPPPHTITPGSQAGEPAPALTSEKDRRLTPVMTVTPASEDVTENTVVTKKS